MATETFPLGDQLEFPEGAHPVTVVRPDGITVRVDAGPYVLTMPGDYTLTVAGEEPVTVTAQD